MRKVGSLSQEQPQQPLAASEQPAQAANESITSEQPAQAANESITSVAPDAAVIVTCALCDAGFVPTPECEYAWKVDATELEAAFMRVCHFCFRCRRAACPECWDPVHRVCAQCVAEAGLTFRTEPSPLADLIFPPITSARQVRDESTVPFVCMRHGRYQSAETAASDPVTDHAQQRVAVALSTESMSKLPTDDNERAVQLSQPALPAVAAPAKKPVQVTEQAEHESICKPRQSAFKIVERTLTIIALAVLLAVIILVVLAEVSTRANNEIARLLHVDIRAEVAYLIALVKQIHW